MDVILELADDYIFDRAYAYLLPSPSSLNTFDPSFLPANASLLASSGAYASYPLPPAPSSAISSSSLASSTFSYASQWPRDNMYRQAMSLFWIAWIGSFLMYFAFSSLSYYFIFDHRLQYHPKFLKNQIWREIKMSMIAMPTIDIMTLPWFVGEVRGHSLLYDNVADYGWAWLAVSTVLYLVFNDVMIYWIHRLEHHKSIYKYIHKPHHAWLVPTPFAALAFHPLDGYAQSLPYHIFVYICPMQKHLYLVLFVLVQLWTILIHDGDMLHGTIFDNWLNSPAHHTLHHLLFHYNMGQYFVWADRYWGTEKLPMPELDPLIAAVQNMRRQGVEIDERGRKVRKGTHGGEVVSDSEEEREKKE